MTQNSRPDTTKIRKGDLVRLKKSFTGSLTVTGSEALYWGEEWGYSPSDWFEVVAPFNFEGSDLLTVKFAKIPGKERPPTRKPLDASKSYVIEIKRPEAAPVYKKQLALF